MPLRRLFAVLLVLVSIGAWTTGAWTQELLTPSAGTAHHDAVSSGEPDMLDERVHMQWTALMEQRRRAHEALLDHHARVVQHVELVEETQLEHQERTRSALGDRAPTETVPPMATVPPIPPAH
jgi:hypothetical protein